MREIRTSGSEGGAGRKARSYLYLLSLFYPAELVAAEIRRSQTCSGQTRSRGRD